MHTARQQVFVADRSQGHVMAADGFILVEAAYPGTDEW